MKDLSNYYISKGKNVVADFICPTKATRDDFDADFLIWVDTIKRVGLKILIFFLSHQKIQILE